MRLLDEAFQNELCDWLSPEDGYLIGVSGGRDSVALLHFLKESGFDKLIVCHLNHQLRGRDSDGDEEFVRTRAVELGYPFFSHQENVYAFAKELRLSVETAAREARHRFFVGIAAETDCPRLLLAHHADDQVETLLINLFRGTGLRGLGGMRRESGLSFEGGVFLTILRPFLEIFRSAIDEYLKRNQISWREDASNAELFALRNRVRHRLIPVVDEVFERDVRGGLLRLAEIARQEEEDAEAETVERYQSAFLAENGGSLAVSLLRSFSESGRRRLILHWLRNCGVSGCGYREVRRISEMVMSQSSPAKTNLPGGCNARRRAGCLFLEMPQAKHP